MPVHDWTRVSAGTFHDFHNAWIIHLKETLNGGLLPEGFYAMSEQHAGRVIADVLTLHVGEPLQLTGGTGGPIAVADFPPRVRRQVKPTGVSSFRTLRKSLAIRHASDHRLVALLEILSPANKDRAASVKAFVDKAGAALQHGCHLLIIDLFPPGPHDPRGIHERIWEMYGEDDEAFLEDKPLTLAAYLASPEPQAFLNTVAMGDLLPDMPLFLDVDWYVNVPLESTYQTAYCGVPAYWRGVIEGQSPAV